MAKVCSIVASFILLFAVSTANADSVLCDATQASTDSLPILANNCPIGHGLWGKRQPSKKNHSFWIQCGVFKHPLPVSQARLIYRHISTDVWMKSEKGSYRCLIGPYDNYSTASFELKNIHKMNRYQHAFLREVNTMGSGSKPVANIPKNSVKKESSATLNKIVPTVHQVMPKIPKGSQITIRKKADLDNILFVVPFVDRKSVQFYMEYDKPWNRMNYTDAVKTCHMLDMNLSTVSQWKKLLHSKLMKNNQWPIYLPYWGVQNIGLFTSGKTSQLKGTSLLNVLCVRL